MSLDAPTLFVSIVAIGGLGTVLLYLVWHFSLLQGEARDDSIRHWAISLGAVCLGTLLGGLRDVVPETVSIVAGNGLILAGVGLRWTAAAALWRVGRNDALAMLPAVGWVVLCLFPGFYEDFLLRGLYVQTSIAVLAAVTCSVCVFANRDGLHAGYGLAILYAIMAACHFAVAATLLADEIPDFAALLQHPVYKAYLVMVLIATGANVVLAVAIVIEREELRHRIAARLDPLTGLPNRRAFFQLAEASRVAAAQEQATFAVVVFDLDHFKAVNDRHGHPAGDEVLSIFSEICRISLRPCDVVGRIGGEEFAAALPRVSIDAAQAIADRIRRAFARAVSEHTGGVVSGTLSAGVFAGPASRISLDEALAAADRGLYRAKRAGRNRVERGEVEDIDTGRAAAQAASLQIAVITASTKRPVNTIQP